MNFRYFLGANSADGFYSLYDGFCKSESDYLSVIKGGPGTGKSGFMRKIGEAAEQRGYDVEYVLCSGDPASLDGVYIPKLHRGWMDGTSPHAAEPDFFGADGDYIDLSRFCKTPLAPPDAEKAKELYSLYKTQYSKAYAFLRAVSAVRKAFSFAELTDKERETAKNRALSILPKPKHKRIEGNVKYRFLRCLGGGGETALNSEIGKICKKIYTLAGGRKSVDYALKLTAREASERGLDTVICLSPMEPSDYEAVLIPELGLAVTDMHYKKCQSKTIALSADELMTAEQIRSEKELMSSAFSCLAAAKKQHDELEQVYKRAMDFDALTAFTESYISALPVN